MSNTLSKMLKITSDERETIRLAVNSHYLLEGYSEIEAIQHIKDMLNSLSIQYTQIEHTPYYSCNCIDDDSDTESTFNILFKYHKVYIQRTDHEFTEFRNVLIKISEYLKKIGFEIKNVQNLNLLSTFMMYDTSNVLTLANKEYCEYELERSSEFVDTQNVTIAYRAAYEMMYYMGKLAINDPSPPYFTEECPYLKRIIKWVYNKDSVEANLNLSISYVSQIVKSLKFIYKLAQVTYIKPKWFEQFVPYIINYMKSDEQHIQRTALMVATYLKNTKGINGFIEIKKQVNLVSKDAAAIKYLKEL
jgi:hypothetical protein